MLKVLLKLVVLDHMHRAVCCARLLVIVHMLRVILNLLVYVLILRVMHILRQKVIIHMLKDHGHYQKASIHLLADLVLQLLKQHKL